MEADELNNAQTARKERYSHPKISRLDKRALNGQLERERQQERELKAIRRRIKKLIGEP